MGRTGTVEHGLAMQALAARISKKFFFTKQAQVARVLQTWVNSGLIIPDGPVHQGAGKYRSFQESELLKAAVLFELYCNAYPIHQLKWARAALDKKASAQTPSILERAALGERWYFHLTFNQEMILIDDPKRHLTTRTHWLYEFSRTPYNQEPWGDHGYTYTIEGKEVRVPIRSMLTIRLDYILHGL